MFIWGLSRKAACDATPLITEHRGAHYLRLSITKIRGHNERNRKCNSGSTEVDTNSGHSIVIQDGTVSYQMEQTHCTHLFIFVTI